MLAAVPRGEGLFAGKEGPAGVHWRPGCERKSLEMNSCAKHTTLLWLLVALLLHGCNVFAPQDCPGAVSGSSELQIEMDRDINVWDFASLSDGSTVVAGSISTDPSAEMDFPLDAHIMKCDAAGEVQWTQSWDMERYDEWTCIEPSGDGGFYLAGITGALVVFPGFPLGDGHLFIAKINGSGREVWVRTIVSTPPVHPWSLIANQDGTFIVAGIAGPDAFWAKYDAGGSEMWRHTYPQAVVLGGTMSSDGGYAFSGQVDTYLGVFRTDADGELVWRFDASTVPVFNISGAAGHDLVQTSDGGYAAVSNFVDEIHGETMFVAKLDAGGGFLWGTFVPGAPISRGYGLVEATDRSLVVGGESHSRHPLFQIVRTCYRFHGVRLSEDGEILWSERLGGLSASAYAINLDANGQIVFAGTSNADRHFIYVLTTDAGGI